MFTLEELLSKRNQRDALEHFKRKKDGCGEDGLHVADLEEYWSLNQERVLNELMLGIYEPGVVKCIEIINRKGKKRVISSLNVLDRFICRLISQKLRRYLEPEFLPNSFAYQENKGILDAVQKAKDYILAGDKFAVVLDIKDFFDTVSIDRVLALLKQKSLDQRVVELIEKYLYCNVSQNGRIVRKTIGLVQGNSMSPVLSNLYLHELDLFLESNEWHWIRFSDDITIYAQDKNGASEIYNRVVKWMENIGLIIHEKKSGVYPALERKLLGYEFYKTKSGIDVRKIQHEKMNHYHNWHPSALRVVSQEYHIIQDGILNKQDYALLFENEQEKHHIPVEVVDSLNVYGDITISSPALKTLSERNIRVAIFGKYGDLMGHFIPAGHERTAVTLLRQCLIYNDVNERLRMAKQMQIASLHNLRANARYYSKRQVEGCDNIIAELSKCIIEINETAKIEELLLIEARARQKYYTLFNKVLLQSEFVFEKRTKRPPEDELNAMISFGNTLLYNQILRMIQKTTLDSRIGIVHATNRRSTTLNLDFADLFKPLIVDRVIFSMINRMQIRKEKHFENGKNGGIYLNKSGKKIFLETFEEKLNQHLVIKGKGYSYRQLMMSEIHAYQRYITNGEKYKPYKYY